MSEVKELSPFSPPACDINPPDSLRAGQLFSVKWLLGLSLAWLALFPFQSWQSLLSIALVMLTWLFGCPKTRHATKLVLVLMFIPAGVLWTKARLYGFSDGLDQEIGTALLSFEAEMLYSAPFNGLILFGMIFLASVTMIRFFPAATLLVVSMHLVLICCRVGLAMILGNC